VEIKATVDEAIGVAKEVQGFWGKLSKMFGAASSAATPQPVAKKKKEKFVAVDETKVMATVVEQLTEFFKLQEQLAAHIREEEEKSRSVYDPDANLMEAALKRVMAMDQMAALEVTIRETMVYQSPPEMGALYSKVFEMRDVIQEEQEAARLKEEAKERYKQWQRQEERRDFQAKSAYLVITFLFLLYLWMWFLFVARLGKT
jgi:ABC-type hemin transport system substrate-binding protein